MLLCLTGCAQWEAAPRDKQAWKLPAPKMSPDSVVLEVVALRVTAAHEADATLAWTAADEQILESELRRRLLENGWRCGKVSVQLPMALQRLLDARPTQIDLSSPDAQQFQEDALTRPFRIQSRSGVRTAIPVGTLQPNLNVLRNDQGAVRGETFTQAQCMLGLRTFPQSDNLVRLELTPEIEHGEPKNRRVAADGMWRLDFSRDRQQYEDLRMELAIAPGETLLVSCAADAVGLGGTFFRRPRGETVLMLIRLAQTQNDALFDEDRDFTPIASSGAQ